MEFIETYDDSENEGEDLLVEEEHVPMFTIPTEILNKKEWTEIISDKYIDIQNAEYLYPVNIIEFDEIYSNPIEVFNLFFQVSLFFLLSDQTNLYYQEYKEKMSKSGKMKISLGLNDS